MSESYREKMQQAKRASYVKRVVAQPTRQSTVKVVPDRSSPSGIREKKDRRS